MDFKAELPSSKSLVNRYLILKEGYPNLSLKWKSKALDVVHLKEALEASKNSQELYIGEGGTSLRFLALYLSSQKGKWVIRGEASLFKRPQTELIEALQALGCKAEMLDDKSLELESGGWKSKEIEINAVHTTQVLTGLVLAAIASKNELSIKVNKTGLNSDYFEMTKKFVASLGFDLFIEEDLFVIPKEQNLKEELDFKHLESDWSSAAFIYVLASIFGKARVQGLMKESIQPDARVLEILKSSGVKVSNFKVEKSNKPYLPMHVNLQSSPDLFPVLSVFACFCRGESVLYGAPQLVFKESNRIEAIYRLLSLCGYKLTRMEDGIKIKGSGKRVLDHEKFKFDVSTDHRLFMACEILKKMGYQIEVVGTSSIEKSFPEYLSNESSHGLKTEWGL